MRYCASKKFEIIRLVEQSNLSVRQTLLWLGIRKSTFYNWLKRYQSGGIDELEDQKKLFLIGMDCWKTNKRRLSSSLWKSLNYLHGNWP